MTNETTKPETAQESAGSDSKRLVIRPVATWSISLDCDCPGCGKYVDLLDYVDFWDGNRVAPCEHDTDNSTELDVVCPECGHGFEVDLTY